MRRTSRGGGGGASTGEGGGARSWTPVRRGAVYCSAACGRGCTWREYEAARDQARALATRLGAGWEPRVSENLGWFWAVRNGGVSVVASGPRSFTAYCGEPGRTYGGGYWFGTAPTVVGAVRAALVQAETHAAAVADAERVVAELGVRDARRGTVERGREARAVAAAARFGTEHGGDLVARVEALRRGGLLVEVRCVPRTVRTVECWTAVVRALWDPADDESGCVEASGSSGLALEAVRVACRDFVREARRVAYGEP